MCVILSGAKRIGNPGEYGYGDTSSPIHLSDLQCFGNESSIYHCNGNEEPNTCNHNSDISVECLRELQFYVHSKDTKVFSLVTIVKEW